MGNALGMIELSSIARGIETCDYMVKAAQVDLVRTSTVCPGKYIIIISGDTADVRASMTEGSKIGGPYVVDTLLIPNIKFYSIASAITAADVAAKAADVTLIEVRIGYAIGGKGFVTLTGDVGAVRAAVSAAKENAELLVNTSIIPRPANQLFDALL